jgi:hypothetical protein
LVKEDKVAYEDKIRGIERGIKGVFVELFGEKAELFSVECLDEVPPYFTIALTLGNMTVGSMMVSKVLFDDGVVDYHKYFANKFSYEVPIMLMKIINDLSGMMVYRHRKFLKVDD